MSETKTIVDGWELVRWGPIEAKEFRAGAYARGDMFNISAPSSGQCLMSEWKKTQHALCPMLRLGEGEVTPEQEVAWMARNFKRINGLKRNVEPAETLGAGVTLGRRKTWRERVAWRMIEWLVPEAFVHSPVLKKWARGEL